MDKIIACCGLDCAKCKARIATLNDDNALREAVAENWSKLNGVEITAAMINCTGCLEDGVKTPFCDGLCEIRKCALKKSFKTCGECANMNNCDKLGMITLNNAEAMDNLKRKSN